MQMVLKWLSRSPESNDTQYDWFRPDLTYEHKLDWRSNFEIGFLGIVGDQSICPNEWNTMV